MLCSHATISFYKRAYNLPRLQALGALYFLEPMLIELGLGTSVDERDRLASDEPNVNLPSPT
jgi:hypothetical protein